MAVGALQLIRQEIHRSCAAADHKAEAVQPIQQADRQQRWAASSSLAECYRGLWSDVASVQSQSQDAVFARQVPLWLKTLNVPSRICCLSLSSCCS